MMIQPKVSFKLLASLDFAAHLLVYLATFFVVQQLLALPLGQAYQQFQLLPVQPPVTYATVFALLHLVAISLPKQQFAMLDYVIDMGMYVIPVLSSIVALFVALQSGFWYMWLIAILATAIHLYVRVQLPKRSTGEQAPPTFSFVSLAAIAYVGSYIFLAFNYLLR